MRCERLVKQVQSVQRPRTGGEPSAVRSDGDVWTPFEIVREDRHEVNRSVHEAVHILPAMAELCTVLQEHVIVRPPGISKYHDENVSHPLTNLVHHLSWCFFAGQLQLLTTFFCGTVSLTGLHTNSFTVLQRSFGTLTQSVWNDVEHCCFGTR